MSFPSHLLFSLPKMEIRSIIYIEFLQSEITEGTNDERQGKAAPHIGITASQY